MEINYHFTTFLDAVIPLKFETSAWSCFILSLIEFTEKVIQATTTFIFSLIDSLLFAF